MSDDQLSQELIAKVPAWKKIGVKDHHGFLTPLFSLKTHQSCGIGEYLDLMPLLEWTKAIGLDVVQLLPLNDGNKNPYSPLSSKALNPIYLSLAALPQAYASQERETIIEELQQLNSEPHVSYDQVFAKKETFLKHYFDEMSLSVRTQDDYLEFLKANPWVIDYGFYKALKSLQETDSLQEWPKHVHALPDDAKEKFKEQYQSLIDYHIFCQFLCFQQLKQAKLKAEELGIFLLGDFTFSFDKQSADVWFQPELFDTKVSTGAPPDKFTQGGQDWGFPLFDLEQMRKSHFQWWKDRLKCAEQYLDIFRMDHAINFFRTWVILPGKKPEDGFYIPRTREEWMEQGNEILKIIIANTNMLPIGEDLGSVTTQIKEALINLGVCGIRILPWEKSDEGSGGFIPHDEYDRVSVTTVSTHDSESLREWWQKYPDEAKAFAKDRGWTYQLPMPIEYHQAILRESHHTNSLFHINLLMEYLALIPHMRVENPEEDRINVPGTDSDSNWAYRFRPYLEEMTGDKKLFEIMTSMVK